MQCPACGGPCHVEVQTDHPLSASVSDERLTDFLRSTQAVLVSSLFNRARVPERHTFKARLR